MLSFLQRMLISNHHRQRSIHQNRTIVIHMTFQLFRHLLMRWLNHFHRESGWYCVATVHHQASRLRTFHQPGSNRAVTVQHFPIRWNIIRSLYYLSQNRYTGWHATCVYTLNLPQWITQLSWCICILEHNIADCVSTVHVVFSIQRT